MKIRIKKLLKEELEAIMSEELSSDQDFIAVYRTYLWNQGEQDVAKATKAAEQALEVLKNTGSSIQAAIDSISKKNIEAHKEYVANNPSPTKKPSRPWPTSQSPMERAPHTSAQEE